MICFPEFGICYEHPLLPKIIQRSVEAVILGEIRSNRFLWTFLKNPAVKLTSFRYRNTTARKAWCPPTSMIPDRWRRINSLVKYASMVDLVKVNRLVRGVHYVWKKERDSRDRMPKAQIKFPKSDERNHLPPVGPL
jgi:hypothetical protein